ncbi:MAG: hypothetical protein HQL15_03005 [Candidatus Omnitrophica bacterium]|nr:hypothetical protein [Candidatus Omnitrophota bacterium]
MKLLTQPIPLKDSEYKSFVKLIYNASGINLGDQKQELVKTRLGKRLRALGLKSYGDYFDYVTHVTNHREMTNLINAISTNFTAFYREPQHFSFLLKTALPDISRRKQALQSRKIRVWCAASSSGEEAYSLSMTLLDYFKDPIGWDIKLLATDISTKVLTEAYHGIYRENKLKPVHPALLDRYFDKEIIKDAVFYQAKDLLKQVTVFRRLNLLDPIYPFQGPFDFIFCRNVMIYFDQPMQEAIVEKLLKYLLPGGYLFISHSENLSPVFRSRVETLAPATYRKK